MKNLTVTTAMIMFMIYMNIAHALEINFDSLANQTKVGDQFQIEGVIFSTESITGIKSDAEIFSDPAEATSSPNILVGGDCSFKDFNGVCSASPIFIDVVDTDRNLATVNSICFNLISVGHEEVTVTAQNLNGDFLGDAITFVHPDGPENGLGNQDPIRLFGPEIASVSIFITTPGSSLLDGFGIDDVEVDCIIDNDDGGISDVIDFDILTNQTKVGNQFQIKGAIFSTESITGIKSDAEIFSDPAEATSSPNILVGGDCSFKNFNGVCSASPIFIDVVDIDRNPATVNSICFNLISVGHEEVTVTAQNLYGNFLGDVITIVHPDGPENGLGNQDPIRLLGSEIARVSIFITTSGSALIDGFGIDDVDVGCNDAVDPIAPQTFIDSVFDGLGAAIADEDFTFSDSITIGFSGTDDVGVTGFECNIDGIGFVSCNSPLNVTTLAIGTHNVQLRAIDGAGNSDTSPVQFSWTIITPGQGIGDLKDIIILLPPNVFKNKNTQNALSNKLDAVITLIDEGDFQNALDKLQNDIRNKMDGCAVSGSPDRNDWVKDCVSQEQLLLLVDTLISFLLTRV